MYKRPIGPRQSLGVRRAPEGRHGRRLLRGVGDSYPGGAAVVGDGIQGADGVAAGGRIAVHNDLAIGGSTEGEDCVPTYKLSNANVNQNAFLQFCLLPVICERYMLCLQPNISFLSGIFSSPWSPFSWRSSGRDDSDAAYAMSLSPDGRSLACVHVSGAISLHTVPGLKEVVRVAIEEQACYDDLSPQV